MITAIDCDLHKMFAVRSDGSVLHKGRVVEDQAALRNIVENSGELILFEVSSPILYRDDPKAIYHTVRWALYNIAMATALNELCIAKNRVLLVSPSHAWTAGHKLELRHKVAECKQPEKNLREAEAMLFYHALAPDKWISLSKYLEDM